MNTTKTSQFPPGWQLMQVGDLFDATAGGDYNPSSSNDVQDDHYPYPIYANGIEQQGLYGFSNYAEAQAGSITVTGRGALGNAFHRDTPFVAIGRLIVLKPKVSLDTRFFCEYINYGIEFAVESTGVPQLTAPQISNYLLPVPPEHEQRAIAEVLSDVDGLINALEALIAKKRAIKQATMQQLLTGKTRLPGFSGEWETVKMGQIGSIYGGLSGKTKIDFESGNARYVTFLGVLENVILDVHHTECVHVRQGESQNSVMEGDLLFNASSETPGDLAIGAVMGEQLDNLYLNSFCFGFRIHDKDKYVPLFLAYFFRGSVGRVIMNALAQGATRYNMSKSQFRALELSIPSGEEQRAIAAVLSDMDAEIAALEHRRDKTIAIKQGMMQQLLTGKVRLFESRIITDNMD